MSKSKADANVSDKRYIATYHDICHFLTIKVTIYRDISCDICLERDNKR